MVQGTRSASACFRVATEIWESWLRPTRPLSAPARYLYCARRRFGRGRCATALLRQTQNPDRTKRVTLDAPAELRSPPVGELWILKNYSTSVLRIQQHFFILV